MDGPNFQNFPNDTKGLESTKNPESASNFSIFFHLDRCIEYKEPIFKGKGVWTSSDEGAGAHPPD